eukprot:Rmarinus@m.18376
MAHFLGGFLALAVLCSFAWASPHVVLVVVDDMGIADVGFSAEPGQPKPYTPTLDSLADTGVVLENFYAQPICTPSRVAMLTGRYPFRAGLNSSPLLLTSRYGLPLGERLLPEELREEGYATHLVGKWHLGMSSWEYTPTFRGFDTYFGFLTGKKDHFTHRLDTAIDLHNGTTPFLDHNNEYSSELFSRVASEIIDQHDTSKPMFMYLAYQAPHDPKQVPPEYEELNPDFTDPLRRTHVSMVSAIDVGLNKVIQTLKNKGMWEDTLLFFLSDNGGHQGEGASNYPYTGGKGTVWEGGVHVCGLMSGGLVERSAGGGKRYPGLMHMVDVSPTIFAAIGRNVDRSDRPFDGVSQWEAITNPGGATPRRELLLAIETDDTPWTSHFLANVQHVNMPQRPFAAFRSGHLKLVIGDPGSRSESYYGSPGSSLYLYNVTADLREENNLAEDPAYETLLHEMVDRVDVFRSQAGREVNAGGFMMSTAFPDFVYSVLYSKYTKQILPWCGEECLIYHPRDVPYREYWYSYTW